MNPTKSGKGNSGMARLVDAVDFDVSDSYNRIAETSYVVFGPGSQPSMPIAACAYPINMGEHMIAVIRDRVVSEDHCLCWPMDLSTAATPEAGGYRLYCNWQGRTWEQDGERHVFIENAVGWVDWIGDETSERLDVKVTFARPKFINGVATMIVDFDVCERGSDGSIARNIPRPFRIYADGRCEPQF